MIRWTFRELGEVSSTQTIARDLAAQGAPEGTTVVAKSQISGEGRLGRSWVSPEGGLFMSFVLRPARLIRPEIMTLVSAVAVVEGLNQATNLHPVIRWPNDVLVSGRKLAGIIGDAQTTGQQIAQIIVGIGVNCNAPVGEQLVQEATSILEETGKAVNVSELRHATLDSFSRLYDRWQRGEDLLAVWKGHVKTLGKDVLVKLKARETPSVFRAVGLDEEGSLILDSLRETRVLRVEDMEWLREQD
jgi:BirA family transcriptional regulator, biotin operon repressor / biotin---[acetyl-CoA-carboxylase] ligase